MKFQSVAAFEKNISTSRIFLIVSACPYERQKIAEKIVCQLRAKEGEVDLRTENGGDIEGLIAGLNTASLLMGKQVVYFNEVDKLKKDALVLLAEYAAKPSPFSYLLLGASSTKGLGDLISSGKKEMIVCDLSEEKPWTKKERYKRLVADFVALSRKRIATNALEYLLENVGLNLSSLEQEIAKLITYIGERPEISMEDVRALVAVQKGATLWQLAESLVWHDALPKTDEAAFDLSTLLPLIAQLRTQLQIGMTLAVLMERGAPPEEIAHHLPTLKTAVLEKISAVARQRRSGFFKRSLDLLFEVELLAKNSAYDPALILDLFLTKITLLKRYTARRQ